MNAVLRKEARLLLPAWLVALAASTLPVCLVGQGDLLDSYSSMTHVPLYFFAAGVLLLSLSSFGLEMSLGTFPSLLAQPRPRLDTWQMKIGLLALALASVVAAAVLFWWLRVHTMLTVRVPMGHGVFLAGHYPGLFSDAHVRFLLLLAVVAFAGGLWTTLLFRQTLTSFWIAILVPLLLYRASLPLLEPLELWNENDVDFVMASLALVFCSYAAVGYGLARWLFLHAQLKPAREVTDAAAWSFLPALPRLRWPMVALLGKELRLQQGTLLIAIVLVVLHLAALAVRWRLFAHPAATENWLIRLYCVFAIKGTANSLFQSILMLWWVVPLLVGCVSIAGATPWRAHYVCPSPSCASLPSSCWSCLAWDSFSARCCLGCWRI